MERLPVNRDGCRQSGEQPRSRSHRADGTTVYRGNNFLNGWSEAGGFVDAANNVENAYIQAAAAGMWTVQVTGNNVPSGPQPFARVVDGDFGPVGVVGSSVGFSGDDVVDVGDVSGWWGR